MPRTRLWPRSQLDLHALMLKQSAYAKYVISVADRDTTAHSISAHDVGHALGRLRRVRPLCLRNQSLLRNAAPQEIIFSHPALAVLWVLRRSSRRNHDRGHSFLEQFVTVIQPRAVNRRGMPGILGGPENSDHIGFFRR